MFSFKFALEFSEWLWSKFRVRGAAKYRLLVVEDNANDALLVSIVLKRAGYQFDCVNTAEAGAALYAQFEHSLVIIDMKLPLMDGWSLAKKILDSPTQTQVVLYPGSARDLDRIEPGYALMVVVKSRRTEALIEAINKTRMIRPKKRKNISE